MRRESGGTRGLEDGVRCAVLEAGGVASEVWTLAHTTELTDRALGAPTLALSSRPRTWQQAARSTFRLLFRELGVQVGQNGAVSFDVGARRSAGVRLRHRVRDAEVAAFSAVVHSPKRARFAPDELDVLTRFQVRLEALPTQSPPRARA